jgi:hypothetical protein
LEKNMPRHETLRSFAEALVEQILEDGGTVEEIIGYSVSYEPPKPPTFIALAMEDDNRKAIAALMGQILGPARRLRGMLS